MAELVELEVLINEAYFRQFSPIPENYNLKELKPYFRVAESLWIEPLIGTPLYQELLEQVAEDNVTPENATLLLHIYPLESFAICYEALPFITYHFSEIGTTKGHSENSDSVSINDVNFISAHLRSQCEVMKSMLKRFLDEHRDLYPLYYGDDIVDPECAKCKCEDYDWVQQYFNGGYGITDKYEWLRMIAKHKMNGFKPKPYAQVYTTRRMGISLR